MVVLISDCPLLSFSHLWALADKQEEPQMANWSVRFITGEVRPKNSEDTWGRNGFSTPPPPDPQSGCCRWVHGSRAGAGRLVWIQRQGWNQEQCDRRTGEQSEQPLFSKGSRGKGRYGLSLLTQASHSLLYLWFLSP